MMMTKKGELPGKEEAPVTQSYQGRAGARWTNHLNPLNRIAPPF